MAKKGKVNKKKEPVLKVDPARQREIVGIGLMAVGGLTVLSLLSASHGNVSEAWLRLLQLGFGWGYIFVPFGLILIGLWLVLDSMDRRPDVGWEQPLGGLLLFVLGLAFLHIIALLDDPRTLPDSGRGGGYTGWMISQVLQDSLGLLGAVLVLLAGTGIGLILLLGRSVAQMLKTLGLGVGRLRDVLHERQAPYPSVNLPPSPASEPVGFLREVLERVRESPILGSPPADDEALHAPGQLAAPIRPVVPRIIGGKGEYHLPPLADILDEHSEQELSKEEIRQKARIIEETLSSFGVPARVVEVNQGPAVTQFGVEPGFVERRDNKGRVQKAKVKVSRIASLSNDLALALSARTIRIEAPVPGRPIVGIEVPNEETHMVGLRSLMESEAFAEVRGPLRVALGQDVSGQPVCVDLTLMPHLLIAGATGSGKSVCINSLIACLLCTHTPDTLKLLMVDPKRVELVNFNGVPHLVAPVVVDLERVVGVLKWATNEMDKRYKAFAEATTRNIEAYNEMAVAKGKARMPYLVIIIDEMADLMMVAAEEAERLICRLAQLARATGIHLVLATQRPSVDVVTGLIKANFPARISFAVTSQVDSRVILDVAGAEKLLGKGDMLYMAPDASKLARLQGCFVSDRELDRLVRYWKGMATLSTPGMDETRPPGEVVPPGTYTQRPLWEDLVAQQQTTASEDELFDEAVALVRRHGAASVSLLQRKLRIGYSRAARLIDLMEEEGIIGPAEGTNKPRPILIGDDLEEGDADDEEW